MKQTALSQPSKQDQRVATVSINGDKFVSGSGTLFSWDGANYSSLSSVQSALGFETSGRMI